MSPSIVGHPPATDYLPCSRAPQPRSLVEPQQQRPREYCIVLLRGMQTRWFDDFAGFDAAVMSLLERDVPFVSYRWSPAHEHYTNQ